MTLTHFLRLHVRKYGLDVRRADYKAIELLRLAKQLEVNNCDVVLDVGANTGQFASGLFEEGYYDGEIISFEPLPDAHDRLVAKAQTYRAKGKNWRVAPPVAVGAAVMAAQFHVSDNSVSSSLAPIMQAHLDASPLSMVTKHINVDIRPLDLLVDDLGIDSKNIFLKMDTQGTEQDVLAGALPIMDRISGIRIELSVVNLYLGQLLYPEMDKKLRDLGFQLWDLIGEFRHPSSLKLLQFDGIYFR